MKKEKKSKSSTSSEPIPISEQSKKYHTPVLLKQSVDALQIQPAGIYVDCTFGGGGHARAILNQLGSEGKLVAFDQDEDSALQLPDDQRMIFVPHNFRHLSRFLRLHGIGMIDGILADLGVSSHHLDSAERGFSTRFDAPLDMRMDRKQSLTAAEVIITYDEKTLHRLFEQYGEVTNARTLWMQERLFN